jgi:hypothetical protein
MFEHDAMRRTAVSYSARCEISETPSFCAFPRPKATWLFLIFCTVVECEFSKMYFLPQLVFILLSIFVHIPSLARPCISSGKQIRIGSIIAHAKCANNSSSISSSSTSSQQRSRAPLRPSRQLDSAEEKENLENLATEQLANLASSY